MRTMLVEKNPKSGLGFSMPQWLYTPEGYYSDYFRTYRATATSMNAQGTGLPAGEGDVYIPSLDVVTAAQVSDATAATSRAPAIVGATAEDVAGGVSVVTPGVATPATTDNAMKGLRLLAILAIFFGE